MPVSCPYLIGISKTGGGHHHHQHRRSSSIIIIIIHLNDYFLLRTREHGRTTGSLSSLFYPIKLYQSTNKTQTIKFKLNQSDSSSTNKVQAQPIRFKLWKASQKLLLLLLCCCMPAEGGNNKVRQDGNHDGSHRKSDRTTRTHEVHTQSLRHRTDAAADRLKRKKRNK